MPREYFQPKNQTSLDSLKTGAKVHVIAVCGVAMAQLAISLSKSGYQVSGSDKQFYEPMGGLLKNSNVLLNQGFDASHVPQDVDLVVIANAPFYENPEVLEVEKRNLPYTCFPQILGEHLIADRHSIVVCGTHGKSTTSAMLAFLLREAQLDPSYFIGGVATSLPNSFHVGKGSFSVVEGDEYHSAFYARVPKFSFYRTKTCILNAIEFDHADIYENIESIVSEFEALISSLPKDGKLICCTDFKQVALIAEKHPNKSISFGTKQNADYRIIERKQEGLLQHIKIHNEKNSFDFTIPLLGEYNARNALAALIAVIESGNSLEEAIANLAKYKSVKRRQEILFDQNDITLIEDFAHHPTAVKETISGLKEAFPTRRLWSIFEPRSNTSRKKIFQETYIEAFLKSDQVLLCEPEPSSSPNQTSDLIDITVLSRCITDAGTPTLSFANASEILKQLLEKMEPGDVVVIMSNGSFDGLAAKLKAELVQRF